MPTVEMIIWSTISGLILIMLGIIGYLVKSGFEGIQKELSNIWQRFETMAREDMEIKSELSAMRARCEERHRISGHPYRRSSDTEYEGC